MSTENDVKCEYLAGKSCKAVSGGAGETVRQDSCSNELKNLCCYLCDHRKSCEIGCDLLDPPEIRDHPDKPETPTYTWRVSGWSQQVCQEKKCYNRTPF